jgi:hypothetical protein
MQQIWQENRLCAVKRTAENVQSLLQDVKKRLDGRKARKTYCFSKDWEVHQAATYFTMYSYN